jgi:hypothetical protein
MFPWKILWKPPTLQIEPGANAPIQVWFENQSNASLSVDELSLHLGNDRRTVCADGPVVSPGQSQEICTHLVEAPREFCGEIGGSFTLRRRALVRGTWTPPVLEETPPCLKVLIRPTKKLCLFVSHGIRDGDLAINEPLTDVLRAWNFETVTVGVEVKVTEAEVANRVRGEILSSPGIVVIATPRTLDSLNQTWKTLEWAHGETGIAFAGEKPILVFQDQSVELGGLPRYLEKAGKADIYTFSSKNIEQAFGIVHRQMLRFRQMVAAQAAKMSKERFKGTLKSVLAALGAGLASYHGLSWLFGEDSSPPQKKPKRNQRKSRKRRRS